MTLNLLPGPEGLQLFACDAEQVEPLSPFPVSRPTLWCWSDDRTHVLVVDQERKRITTFRLEGEEFHRTMSPSTLPKGVRAHCIAMKGDQPYVGARSVWVPRGEREWEQIAMPAFARGAGKRLDGLIIDGDRLVAVDDLVSPKWNLEYDIADPGEPAYVRAEELRANISYERIYSAAGGQRWFVTLSRGINHGNEAAYCTVFHLETLRQVYAYAFSRRFAGVSMGEVTPRRAVFLGDMMCLLVQHEEGAVLHWLDLADAELPPVRKPRPKGKRRSEMTEEERAADRRSRPKRPPKPALHETPVERPKQVHHIHASGNGDGVYLVGRTEDGDTRILWHPAPVATLPAADPAGR